MAVNGCKPRPEYDVRSLAQPEVLSTLGLGEVRAIGQKYRALNPAEADLSAIRAALLRSRPLLARLGLTRPSFAELARDDFKHGRTVVIDGWILPITEARQCALLSSLTS